MFRALLRRFGDVYVADSGSNQEVILILFIDVILLNKKKKVNIYAL